MACEGREVAAWSAHRRATHPSRSVATRRHGLDSRERFACRDGWHFPGRLDHFDNSRWLRELRRVAFVR